MDLDLAEYDQVDEAKFFMNQKDQQLSGGDLLTTYSSEQTKSDELLNCENDFVFLPAPITASGTLKTNGTSTPTLRRASTDETQQIDCSGLQTNSTAFDLGVRQHKAIITSDQLDMRPHQSINTERYVTEAATTRKQDFSLSGNSQQRVAHPLMTIHTNGGNNPFHSLPQASLDDNSNTLASQSSQPFWMRHDNFSNKPIGLLEVSTSPSSSQNASHLSDLMHQIVTKSDSIYIAIPCAFCHEPKACPPSDISAWLNHMNRAHNCKVCPICNKLVGLGPIRDIEIMRKHVVAHIDNDWLESKSFKTNFSFGLQNHWFSSGHCSVKDPRSFPKYK